jgi:hypothetical protein
MPARRPLRSWVTTLALGIAVVMAFWSGLTFLSGLSVPNPKSPPGDPFYLVNGVVLLGLTSLVISFVVAVWRLYRGDRG